jgi:hypothetical protein
MGSSNSFGLFQFFSLCRCPKTLTSGKKKNCQTKNQDPAQITKMAPKNDKMRPADITLTEAKINSQRLEEIIAYLVGKGYGIEVKDTSFEEPPKVTKGEETGEDMMVPRPIRPTIQDEGDLSEADCKEYRASLDEYNISIANWSLAKKNITEMLKNNASLKEKYGRWCYESVSLSSLMQLFYLSFSWNLSACTSIPCAHLLFSFTLSRFPLLPPIMSVVPSLLTFTI